MMLCAGAVLSGSSSERLSQYLSVWYVADRTLGQDRSAMALVTHCHKLPRLEYFTLGFAQMDGPDISIFEALSRDSCQSSDTLVVFTLTTMKIPSKDCDWQHR